VRTFVAGGTGVLGRPLVEALVDRGHEVTASTHRTENFAVIEALGARPALMDGLDDAAVRQAILETEPEVIINQITALSAPSRDYARWLAVTNRLRSEGTKTLMTAAREAGTRRVVAQSASFMTQPVGSDPTDESSPLYLDAPEPIRSHIQANIAAETLVLGTPGIQGVVLRYGFLYGEGTAIGPGGEWATGVKSGDLPIVGEGAGRYPFVQSATQCRPPCKRSTGEAPASTTSWATSPPPRLSGCRTWPKSWTPLRRGASPRRRPRNRSALKPCTTAPSSARPATPRPSLSWG
jgi:nucleoside-diphosphate-sugar epimerase